VGTRILLLTVIFASSLLGSSVTYSFTFTPTYKEPALMRT